MEKLALFVLCCIVTASTARAVEASAEQADRVKLWSAAIAATKSARPPPEGYGLMERLRLGIGVGSAAKAASYSPIELRALRNFEVGTVIFTLSAADFISERTLPHSILNFMNAHALKHEDVRVALRQPMMTYYPLVISLLSGHRMTEDDENWISLWARLFPPVNAHESLLFESAVGIDGCLDPETREAARKLRSHIDAMENLTEILCQLPQSPIPCFLRNETAWAFAIIAPRVVTLGGLPTVLPMVDATRYAVEPALRLGMVHRHADSGKLEAVDIIAHRDIAKGEILTFRSELREASTQLALEGVHRDDAFEVVGTQLWIEWNVSSVENETDDRLNCSKTAAALRCAADGTFEPLMEECAQLRVLRGSNGTELRRTYSFDNPEIQVAGLEFLVNHANLAVSEIPDPSTNRACSSTSDNLLSHVARHNSALRDIFLRFKSKVQQRAEQKGTLQAAMKQARDANAAFEKQRSAAIEQAKHDDL